jgi:hypothetical protein
MVAAMSDRREFTKAIKVAIIKRCSWGFGNIDKPHCEKCGAMTLRFEIDHRDPDAMQIDKSKQLTAAEGWLLCIPCHSEKTKKDVADIAKVKRIEARHLGATTNKAKIPSPPKAPRLTDKLDSIRALGPPIAFRSIGDVASDVLAKLNPKKAAE